MFEAYKIGVKLSLIDGATGGLVALASRFRSTSQDAGELEKRLHRIQSLAIKGAALMGAGLAGFKLLQGPINAAKEYTHQLELMNQAGMSHAEIMRAINTSYGMLKSTPTAGLSETLKTIRELRGVFVHPDDAFQYAAPVMQADAVLSAQLPGISKGRLHDEAYQAAKAIEMANGVRSPAEFMKQLEMMTKAMVAFGGRVTAKDFLGTTKYARVAGQGWDDNFRYNLLPTLIQEMKSGGSGGGMGGPGNALMSLYAQVVQGTIAQRFLPQWIKDGLINKSQIVWNKVGSAKGIKPGAVMGSEEFASNPYKWAQDYMMPALQKSGVNMQDQSQVIGAVSKFGFNRTAAQVIAMMLTQQYKFKRNEELVAQAKGIGGYKNLVKKDPMLASIALHQQWESLLATIGYQIMPDLLKGTQMLITSLRAMSDWFEAHPSITKGLVEGFAAISGLLLGGGVVFAVRALAGAVSLFSGPLIGLATFLLANPIGLVITGIAAAGFLLWKNWDSIGPKLKAIWQGITMAIGAFVDWLKAKWDWFKGVGTPTPYLQSPGSKIASSAGVPWIHPMHASMQTPVIHNHFHVDSKEVSHALVGNNNLHGTPGLNPSVMRPTPSVPWMGQ